MYAKLDKRETSIPYDIFYTPICVTHAKLPDYWNVSVSLWNAETIRGSLMTPEWQILASMTLKICIL